MGRAESILRGTRALDRPALHQDGSRRADGSSRRCDAAEQPADLAATHSARARRVLVPLASSLAVVDALFGSARIGVFTSTMLLAGASLVAGSRTLVASAFAISTTAHPRPATTSPSRLDDAARLLRGVAHRRRGAHHWRLRRAGLAMGPCFVAAASLTRPPSTAHARVTSTAPIRQPSAATPRASRAAARSAVSWPSANPA